MAYPPLDYQRPIDLGLKSVRTVYLEPENPVRWSYLKALSHFENRKIYDVDPYAMVFQFRDNFYGIYTHSLDGMGDPWIYLIIGPQKAMLVDTSFGLGNLKGLVDEITGGMPVILVNTHRSFDHSYGNFQFGECYCSEFEVPSMEAQMNPHIWDYLFDENGKGIYCDFPREDLVDFVPFEIHGCKNGTIFNLGEDYDVELIHLPGHTPGHAAYLDKKNRILIGGDVVCVGELGIGGPRPENPYSGTYATVEGLRNELVKLVRRKDEFDYLFPGHGPVDLGPIVLDNVLEACEKVLADPQHPDCIIEYDRHGRHMKTYNKEIYLSGYLRYNMNSVYMDQCAE